MTPASAAVDPTQPTLIWGAYVRPVSGQSERSAVETLENKVGRSFGASRVFLLWDETFPTTYHTWLRDTDHLPLISVRPRRINGSMVLWRDIANAAPGSATHNQVVGWADRIRDFGAPVYFTFNHEPEASASNGFGTDTDYVNAWRKVISIFRDRKATNAKFLWIMTEYSFERPASDRRQAIKWYPGDEWVDALGADAYNDYTCRTDSDSVWKPLAQDIEAFRRFGLQHPDKEMWLPEWASFEDPDDGGRKAQWVQEAQALFKTEPYAQFRGILYFNSFRPGTPCLWWIDSSSSSLNAFRVMGEDVFYARRNGTPPPPPTVQALLVVGASTLSPGDAAVRQRLLNAGYEVTVRDDNIVTSAEASAVNVVVMTATIDSGVLGSRLRDLPAPVVIWKATLYDDMRLTALNAHGISRSTSVSIVDSTSPLAAGRSGTVTITTTNDYVPWAAVGPAAHVAATVAGRAVLWSYDRGDPLPGGGSAPACRVGVAAYQQSPASFTTDGDALFDAAVDWAASCL